MTQSLANISAQKVKLSVYELNCLTAHPLTAVKCAGYLSAGLYENASICLSSDPAIALAVIRSCKQQNTQIDGQTVDFSLLLKQLSKKDLLRILLTLNVYNPENADILPLIASLVRRSGTRAFAAKLIAEKIDSGRTEAFRAALFADAGLFALAQLFTKSLLMLRQESIEQKIPLLNLQQEHLGITDNILSQMLLQKWQLGDSIADTAWLYKTKATTLIDRLPYGKIISIVRLADMLCDSEYPDDFHNLAQKLSLMDSAINEIKEKVRIFAGQINGLLGLDIENPSQVYSETIKQIYLNQLTAKSYTGDEFEAFVQKFTDNINSQARLIDVAAISAKAIYEIFSAQNVCVFIALPKQSGEALLSLSLQAPNSKAFLTAVIKDGGDVKTTLIESSEAIQSSNFQPQFCRQVGMDIDNDKTQLIPIKSGDETIGGIIFKGSIFDNKQLGLISDFIAKMASIINRNEYEESIAQSAVECLEQIKTQPPAEPGTKSQKETLPETVAEIAAGAAHELNNPLAVISGRAQLLSQSETDETKKTVLNQISEKAKDIHEIVGQLMSYARPLKPHIRTVSPFIIINNALEKVNARYLSEPIDIKLENIESLSDVEADGEQVADAIAQIIYNALESYESGNGPVQIVGKEQGESVEIQIIDSGCGMSEETLQKAVQPFFSEKSAGRQRGMGLSLAESYLKNNGCTLKIESKLEKGTTVTINLPRAGI
ncbi:MAG: ATP-binding protein [Sedimentisphaerales bacterium]